MNGRSSARSLMHFSKRKQRRACVKRLGSSVSDSHPKISHWTDLNDLIGKIVDTLDLYSPMLKGLQDVHAYVCELLESLIFDEQINDKHITAAAYLYGRYTAPTTDERLTCGCRPNNGYLQYHRGCCSSRRREPVRPNYTISCEVTDDPSLSRGTTQVATLALCIFLGVDRSNSLLFENNLPVILQQVQVVAFSTKVDMSLFRPHCAYH